MKRVPHCEDCMHLKVINIRGVTDWSCKHPKYVIENLSGCLIGYGLPKTSPQWCPLRVDNTNDKDEYE